MQDIRLRTGAAILLSVAAFLNLTGALLVFIWWLVFTRRLQVLKKFRLIVPLIVLMAFFSAVVEVTGGGGLSYFFRMLVIVLVGMWMYQERQGREFLDLAVWMFGDRAGFELGLLAEMGIRSLDLLAADFERIRIAEKLKGISRGPGNIVPTGLVLVHGALSRADDTAELLAVRGYHDGGTLCPVFRTPGKDIVACLAAAGIFIITFIPVSEFFILYR
jgi:energy-coupling factor transport system permease protein